MESTLSSLFCGICTRHNNDKQHEPAYDPDQGNTAKATWIGVGTMEVIWNELRTTEAIWIRVGTTSQLGKIDFTCDGGVPE